MTNVVDPLAGSYYVEALTDQLATEAWKLIEEVEELGGMTKAVVSGMPKLRIEAAATERQARIDRGEEVIVGVNKYQPQTADPVEVLDIDNQKVREDQIARLTRVRESRDEAACQAALTELTRLAETGEGNLLAQAVECARARASVGEISLAMESVYDRHRAEVSGVSGVYAAAYDGDADFEAIREDVEAFAAEEGRRPRMMVVKMARTAMTAAPRSSPRPSPISASTSIWARCSRRRKRRRRTPSTMTCTWSASPARRPATRRWRRR